MPYLDTSVVVAVLTREARAVSLQKWLAGQRPDDLIISDWVIAEFSAALAMKLRMRQLTMDLRAEVLAEFTSLVENTLTVWSATHMDFHTAVRMADRHDTNLRAGGALHLAIVANRGERLVSLDRVQVNAAAAQGVSAGLI